jgi:hypothetical protein
MLKEGLNELDPKLLAIDYKIAIDFPEIYWEV